MISPLGWWRFAGAAAAAAMLLAGYSGARLALRLCLFFLPGWRLALVDDVLSVQVFKLLPGLQALVLVYWACLGARGREGPKHAAGAEAAAFLACATLALRLAIRESDEVVGAIAVAFFVLWVAVRNQFGRSPPPFPAIEGRTRFFRVKARLSVALVDTLRTAALSAAAVTVLRVALCASSALFGSGTGVLASGFASLFDLKPLVRPATLQTCWLIHCALHATEVVATERFRFCRAGEGADVAVIGMDSLLKSMGSRDPKRGGKSMDKELAFLDACLLAEKSSNWRRALFTSAKGEHWYALTRAVHVELELLRGALVDASSRGAAAEPKTGRPVTRAALAREKTQQHRAFLTSRNIRSIAASVRDNQATFTWGTRAVTALAKACGKEDPLGVSQRHSKKPSLLDILVTMVSLHMLFASLEAQLAQASGKQSGRVPQGSRVMARVLGVNALGGETEATFTNVYAMADTLKLALYSLVKAFTADLYSLQMESIAETLSRASENSSALRDDPFTEKLPLFYPLWMEEAQLGHGTPSQHAHVLKKILLNNI